jgi:sphingolipid 4-desaturase/C4-monooxygenase
MKPSPATVAGNGRRQQEKRTSFVVVSTPEPHKLRHARILAEFPAVKELYGPDLRLLPLCCLVMSIQALLNYAVTVAWYSPAWYYWPGFMLAAYSVGGTCTHWLSLANHELSHRLCFQTGVYNDYLAMLINCCQSIPSAITFRRYHLEHHQHQGDEVVDVDIPTDWEGRHFTTPAAKVLWLLLQPAFYALRPLIVNPKAISSMEIVNLILVLAFDAALVWCTGTIRPLLFNFLSTMLGMGIHPVATHFISEHYLGLLDDEPPNQTPTTSSNESDCLFVTAPRETFSYYGWLNWLTLNVGHHVEHHDFPRVSGLKLPALSRLVGPTYYPRDGTNSYTVLGAYTLLYRYVVRPGVNPYARVQRPSKKE